MDCPPIGAGTFEIENKEAIIRALQIGYRHLDLAEAYGNLKIVKEAYLQHLSPSLKEDWRSLDHPFFLL